MSKMLLTDRVIAGLPMEKGVQKIVRDADLPGFFVLVGARSKTFMVQGDLRQGKRRQSLRLKVGEVGRYTTREARAKAKVLLGQISEGHDPRPKPVVAPEPVSSKEDPTLRAAWMTYRDSHMRRKERSAKTEESYADHVERLLKSWLDLPLSMLGRDPSLVKARHDELTHESGPYMANGCMRTLRAIYNHARKAARALPPENPVFAVDWNPEQRRDSGLGPNELPAWFDQLRGLDNPLRRELHLFLLLSGSRPEVIKSAKPEHINWGERLLFIPSPKGGAKRAFCIPLSRAMVRCLLRAIAIGREKHPYHCENWIFPSDSATGHIAVHKEKRKHLSHYGNELRQTYRTLGQVADVNDIDMHLLMNHSLPGVNAGYITRGKLVSGHLRQAQQRISDAMLEAIAVSDDAAKRWPMTPVKYIVAELDKGYRCVATDSLDVRR